MHRDTITVLGIAGSLRRGSYNRALLRSAQSLAPDDMRLDIFDLHDVPFYDADVEKQGDSCMGSHPAHDRGPGGRSIEDAVLGPMPRDVRANVVYGGT